MKISIKEIKILNYWKYGESGQINGPSANYLQKCEFVAQYQCLAHWNSNERQNRTSTNMTRSMISTCHLAKSFQVEALQTVAYILSKVHSYSKS